MRQHNKDLRTMKDGAKIALDTMSGVELLQSANLCLQYNQGDARYRVTASNIVADGRNTPNFYITLKMRRTLMGFVRPVFEAEWERRNGNRLQQSIQTPQLSNMGSKLLHAMTKF